MRVLIIALMFVMTTYAVGDISDRARKVEVGGEIINRYLTSAGCLSITVITLAYNAASLYLLIKVV